MAFLNRAKTEAEYAADEEAFAAYQRQCQAEIAAARAAGTCTRCNGRGRIRGFGHVEGGKCFACNGVGKVRRRMAA